MQDILPEYLAIGVSFERFMDSCPVELEPFEAANKKKIETQNSLMYMQGMYVRDAIQSTIGNSQWFKSKGQAAFKYPSEPYNLFGNADSRTDDEKQKDLQEFIAQENIRRANWKMIHARRKEEKEEDAS